MRAIGRQVRSVWPGRDPLGLGFEIAARELDNFRDWRRPRVPACRAAALVIAYPAGAQAELARELGLTPAHAGAEIDKILRLHCPDLGVGAGVASFALRRERVEFLFEPTALHRLAGWVR